MKIHEIIATKRSGHHAMLNWVLKNLVSDQILHWHKLTVVGNTGFWMWNDGSCVIDRGEGLVKGMINSNGQPKNLLVNYEDTLSDYTNFNSDRIFKGKEYNYEFDEKPVEIKSRVLFIRNFYDNIFSRYLAVKNNIIPEAKYDKSYINTWKNHAKFYLTNTDFCLKYEDWKHNSKKRNQFLKNNYNTYEIFDNNHLIGTTTSNIHNIDKDYTMLPEETKDLIRKDNELHYLIGALGYEYKEI